MRGLAAGVLCGGAGKTSRKLKDSVTFVAFFCNKSLVRYSCKSQESFFSFFNLQKDRAGEWFTQALFFYAAAGGRRSYTSSMWHIYF